MSQTKRRTAKPKSGRPYPTVPRASARLCYRLHKVLETNGLWRSVAKNVESHPRAYRLFTALEKSTKEKGFGCRMCGQCALPTTGYVCPMTCPKQLRNGPCGGVGSDGSCEVYPEVRCVWVQAYERSEASGHGDDLRLLQRPVDHRHFGESSWINYWAGRDDNLSVMPVPGTRRPSIKVTVDQT